MTDKSGSPPCGLYIQIKAEAIEENTLMKLRQMAMAVNRASGYEKNYNIIEFVLNNDPASTEKIEALVQVAQADGLLAIIRNDYNAAHTMNADGVILENIEDAKPARDLLGKEKIYGLSCATNKETAKAAAEAELDFIEFGTAETPPSSDLLSWWSTKSEMPAIARGNITNNNCASYARAGAGFVDVGEYVMTYEKGAMQATVNVLHALESVAEGRQVN